MALAIDVPSFTETLHFLGRVGLDLIAVVVFMAIIYVVGGWLRRNYAVKVVKTTRETVVATRSTILPGILAAVGVYLWPQAKDAFTSVPKPLQICVSIAFGTLTGIGGLLATRGREEEKLLSTIVGGALLALPVAGLAVGFIVGDWWSEFLALDPTDQFYIVAGVLLYGIGIAVAVLMSIEKGKEARTTNERTVTTEVRVTGPSAAV
jgi:hypothetical protein